jgi:putative glycosyltransferase
MKEYQLKRKNKMNTPLIKNNIRLSIVTTLFKSSKFIKEFHKRAAKVGSTFANNEYEIIFVNDGCPEESRELIIEIINQDQSTLLIDLSRNFGHHSAIMAGLGYARGDLIFLLDSDLEEQPEFFYSFHDVMLRNNCDVVYGVQEKRRGNLLEKFSGFVFYKVFNFFTKLSVVENLITARLMTKRYVAALLLYEERELTMAGLWQIVGFKQIPLFVNKQRLRKTTYTFTSKIILFINAITSFSNKPLIIIFYTGILIFISALILNVSLVIQWIYFNKPLMGWTSIIASIWLIGGMLISFIGVIGIYIAKIYSETKMRPRVIIRDIIKNDSNLKL